MMIALSCLALYLAVVVQTAFGPSLAIFGVQPDLVFAMLVSICAFHSFFTGALLGTGVGLYMDMVFLTPGVYTLQYLIAGAFSGLVSIRKAGRYIQPLLICLPTYFIKEVIQLAVLSLRGGAFVWSVVISKTLIGAVYTAALSFLFYLAFDLGKKILAKRRKRYR